MKIFLSVLLLAFLFIGCSNKPDKLYLYPKIKDKNSASEIVFIRSNHLIGSIALIYFAVDDKNLTALMGNEYTKIPIPAGSHTISIEAPGGWSPGYKKSDELSIYIKPKEIKYIYVVPNAIFSSYPYLIQTLDEYTAKRIMSNAKYLEE